MVFLSKEERIFVVTEYIRTESFVQTQFEFHRRYPNRAVPAKSTIFYNVRKYKREGSILNLHEYRSGRQRTARSVANVMAVRELLEEANPRDVSARRNGIGISKSAFNRITKEDLCWHPYQLKIRHGLRDNDFVRRLAFSRWFVAQCERPDFMQNIVIGDEATFHLNGKVNTHNLRQYAPKGQPPPYNYDKNESREKVTVWAGLCGNGIILGPFFFEGNVNGNAYLEMLNNDIIQWLMLSFDFNIHDEVLFHQLWWFQDGAPAHGTLNVRQRLRRVFGNKIVALNHEVEWPARSPDLTPCDFFLWGYLKQKVFSMPPPDLISLRRRITFEIDILRDNNDMIRRSVAGMRRRAVTCIERNGQHVEGVL